MGASNLGLGLLLEAKDLASGVLGKFSNTLSDTVGKTSAAGQRIAAGMKQFGLGLGIFSAGAAGLALLGPATEASTAFGFQIARIRTVIDETALSTDAAKKATMGLAATYGIDALQQADSLYETISAGISDATKATALLETANQFAVGGSTGLAGSIDVLTSAVNTYSDQGLTAAQASDMMFTAIAAGKTTAEQISQSLGEVAPTAHAAGVSFGELQAAIGALTVEGIKTPQAVTGLNALMSNLMKPTSDATKEAKRLGIEFSATALKTMGLQGVLAQLKGNAKVNDNTFTELFGSIDGIKTAFTLTANGGAKFNEVLEQMKHASGATKAAFDIMANTTKFQGDRFDALKKNALIVIGDALEPLKLSVLKTVNSIIDGFTKIPAPIRNFMVQAFAVASVMLAVVGGAIALKGAITVGAGALSAMGVSVGGLAAALGPVIGTLALVGVAAYALKRAYDENLGGFAERVDATVASVRLAFSALGQLFESGEFSGAVMDDLNRAENGGIKNFAITIFGFAARIGEFFSGIGKGFAGSMDAVQPAIDMLITSVAPIGAIFSSLFDSNGADESAASFDRFGAAGAKVGSVLATVAAVALKIGSYIGQLVSGAVTGVSKLGSIFSGLGDAFGEVGSAIGEISDALGGASESGLSMSEIFFALGMGIAGVFGIIVGVVRGVVSAIGGILRGLATTIGGVIDIVGGLFSGDWERVWLGVKKVAFGTVQGVIAIVGGLVEGIASALDALGKIVGKDIGAAKTIKGFRTKFEEDVRDAMGVPKPGQPPVGTEKLAAPADQLFATNAATTAPAAAQAQNAERLAAAPQDLFATIAATQVNQKPPVIQQTNTTIVTLDGVELPGASSTRTSTAAGIPTAPAGV